jgi:hypothetical protein
MRCLNSIRSNASKYKNDPNLKSKKIKKAHEMTIPHKKHYQELISKMWLEEYNLMQPKLKERVDFFLPFHLGDNKPGFVKAEAQRLCPGIKFKNNLERIRAIVLESDFEQEEEEEEDFDYSDITVLLTSGSFYVDQKTSRSRKFHSLQDRVGRLRKCYDKISTVYSTKGPSHNMLGLTAQAKYAMSLAVI